MPRSASDKTPDSEKITINLGLVDLGRIDLLVQDGFYQNRTDFIRTAIRTQLAAEQDHLAQSVRRHMLEVGLHDITVRDLEAVRDRGEVLDIRVVGLARIAEDISVELAQQTIGSIRVLGALQVPRHLRAVLKDRTT